MFIPFVGLLFAVLNLCDTWKPLVMLVIGSVLIATGHVPAGLKGRGPKPSP